MTSRAIIFDLDGTLLDTLADIAGACNAALVEVGLPSQPIEAYPGFIGDGAAALIRRALAASEGSPSMHDETLEAFRKHYSEGWAQETVPYPGIVELLDLLADREVPCAVLSNKPHEFTVAMVQHFFSGRFSPVFGQREGIPTKPEPDAAIEIAGELGLTPQECAYVGDSEVDVETAIRAEMLPVAAAWGFRPKSALEAAGAKHIFDVADDLSQFFSEGLGRRP